MKLALTFLASVASAIDVEAMAGLKSFAQTKSQPYTLITNNAYCQTAGEAWRSYRISMNPGNSVASCNELCQSTSGCKRFLFGRQGGYRNRCDLINTDDCDIVPGLYNFDYYQPSQSNMVRLRSSHKSNDANGCSSTSHPQNYLGVRRVGTQEECTNACWQVANCFAFNMHRGSHCHLYSAEFSCSPNSHQDKYYMDWGIVAPPPPPQPQVQPTVTSPASPSCVDKPYEFQVVDMLGRLSYHESEEIIRDHIEGQTPKGVRMATPSEVLAIQANSTGTGGKLSGHYVGVQWVATEGPYHTQEYVNIGDASAEFSIGARYYRQTGSFPSWGTEDGLDQGDPVQPGEHAWNTHILYVVDCTEPIPPPFQNPAANVIAVRGEKQWQDWAQDQNDQLDRQTEAAQTRIPYHSE